MPDSARHWPWRLCRTKTTLPSKRPDDSEAKPVGMPGGTTGSQARNPSGLVTVVANYHWQRHPSAAANYCIFVCKCPIMSICYIRAMAVPRGADRRVCRSRSALMRATVALVSERQTADVAGREHFADRVAEPGRRRRQPASGQPSRAVSLRPSARTPSITNRHSFFCSRRTLKWMPSSASALSRHTGKATPVNCSDTAQSRRCSPSSCDGLDD